MVAEAAVFPHDGVCMSEEMMSDGDAWVQDDVGQDDGVVANGGVFRDHDVRANVGIAANFGGGVDLGPRMDSGRVRGRLVEELDGLCEGEIGIGDAECGEIDLGKVRSYEDGAGMGFFSFGGVFGIGDEGKVPGLCFFNSGDACDFRVVGAGVNCIKLPGQF